MAQRMRALSGLLLCATLATASLNLLTYNNTAFAGPGVASTLNDLSSLAAPPYSSLRVSGTLTPAEADLLLLWVTPIGTASPPTFTGWLLMWLDDHLLIDTAQRGLKAWSNYSFAEGASPPPLRLDWINSAPSPCTISLSWSGNTTAAGVVPASALSPYVAPAEAEVAALRARAASPPWAWGTYASGSLWTHVQMPSALSIEATLVQCSTGKALGAVLVYPNGSPAITRVLGHSYNGSTYTESSVSSWEGAVCTVTLASTIDVDQNLILLASTNGTGCGTDLALLVTFGFQWGRAGTVSGATPEEVVATAPGLDEVRIFATAPSVPVANSKQWKAPFFALALEDGGAVAVSSGGVNPVSPSAAAAAIAAARTAHALQRARFPGDLADAYDAQQTIIAANTLYTPYEGWVTPVTKGWTRGGTGYVIFPWDTLFLAWMAALEPASKDISYANVIAVVQGRTQRGFPPNYHAGTHDIGSRSEPQIGALITLEIYRRFEEAWVVEKLFDTLLGWAEWVWRERLGGGSAPGPLIVLGSDLVAGDDERSTPTLFAAGLESGIDNGVAWEGLDPVADFEVIPGGGGGRMKQYDVGASALFVAECEALAALAAVVNRSAVVPTLQTRAAAVAAAMNASMWNGGEGVYESTLYNGTWHKRRMPTAFYPLLSTALPPTRVTDMLPLLTSPLGFCVNDTAHGDGDADSGFLATFHSAALNDTVLCLSDACIGEAINTRYKYVRQEGLGQLVAPPPTGGAGGGGVPLFQWRNAISGGHALTAANATPPAPGYTLVRQEGFCYAAAGPGMVAITLWQQPQQQQQQEQQEQQGYSGGGTSGEFITCAGNPECLEEVGEEGYTLVGTVCYGFNATTPAQMPCRFSLPSAARADPDYFDNNYWKGRVWGPQVALVWLGLQRHDAVPEARAARQVLVKHALALELQNWRLSRQVLENVNSVCGAGEDGGGWGEDPFYTWGALLGHVALLEAGY